MQVLLAKAYFRGGQKTEAADTCAQVLSRFPYCFDANALMVDILTALGKKDSAGEYRQRVNELDPYAAFARDSAFDAASVPDNAVNIERLEYVAQAPEAMPLLELALQPAEPSEEPREVASLVPSPDDDIPPFLREASSGRPGCPG